MALARLCGWLNHGKEAEEGSSLVEAGSPVFDADEAIRGGDCALAGGVNNASLRLLLLVLGMLSGGSNETSLTGGGDGS